MEEYDINSTDLFSVQRAELFAAALSHPVAQANTGPCAKAARKPQPVARFHHWAPNG